MRLVCFLLGCLGRLESARRESPLGLGRGMGSAPTSLIVPQRREYERGRENKNRFDNRRRPRNSRRFLCRVLLPLGRIPELKTATRPPFRRTGSFYYLAPLPLQRRGSPRLYLISSNLCRNRSKNVLSLFLPSFIIFSISSLIISSEIPP